MYFCRTYIEETIAVQNKSKYKSEFNFDLFWKENRISRISMLQYTCDDHSIDISITIYCRTDIDKARVISLLGVRTDTISIS